MSRRKRRKKEKSRKKLVYGIIAVAFILILLVYYLSFHQSNNQSNETSQPMAAIVDHLSRNESNPAFVQNSRTILEEAGFNVDYHGWQNLTDVDYYKSLFKQSYDLFVLRVHSAITIIGGEEVVSLFTWEHYDPDNIPANYYYDIEHHRIVEAYFSEEEREKGESYFGITHKFVDRYGVFQNSVIIMMGCNGITYTSMAEAFVNNGAKVYISWDGLVGVNHTDQATVHLLQSLLLNNRTIENAVEEIDRDPEWGGSLDYYPHEVGGDTILNLKISLIMNVIHTSPTAKAPTKIKYRAHE